MIFPRLFRRQYFTYSVTPTPDPEIFMWQSGVVSFLFYSWQFFYPYSFTKRQMGLPYYPPYWIARDQILLIYQILRDQICWDLCTHGGLSVHCCLDIIRVGGMTFFFYPERFWRPNYVRKKVSKSLAKIQNGGQALDMVRPFFCLLQIIQKFCFLSLSFHILVTRNDNFRHTGGSQWAPGGLLAFFRAKTAFFKSIFQKSPCFSAF